MNTQRFINTLKVDFANEWKTMLRLTLSMAFGLSIIYTVNILQLPDEPTVGDYANAMGNCSGVTMFVFFLFMGVGGCYMTNIMKTKQQRASYLSLPASMAEKFVARYLWCTVGFLLMYLVAMVIAELLQTVLCLAVHGEVAGSVIAGIVENLSSIKVNNIKSDISDYELGLLVATVISVLVCSHSTYLLGGVFFRKFNWILTTSAYYVISTAASLVLVAFDMEKFTNKADDSFTFAYYIIAFCVAATIFCYWASYRLFCRSQVICNKIVNV